MASVVLLLELIRLKKMKLSACPYTVLRLMCGAISPFPHMRLWHVQQQIYVQVLQNLEITVNVLQHGRGLSRPGHNSPSSPHHNFSYDCH